MIDFHKDTIVNSLHIWQVFMLLLSSVDFSSRLTFLKRSFRNNISVKRFVGPDPGPIQSGKSGTIQESNQAWDVRKVHYM